MTRHERGHSVLIEAGHQVSNGITGAAASSLGSSAVARASSNSKQSFGAGDVASGFRL